MGLSKSGKPDVERLEAARDTDGLQRVLTEQAGDVAGWKAAEALARIGDDRAITALCRGLDRELAPARQHIARLLGEYRAPLAVRPLSRLLSDENRLVRAAAVSSLGRIGKPEAFGALVEALGDSEACVRAQAAEALGLLQDARAIPALSDALYDENSGVRSRAARALQALEQPGETGAEPPATGRRTAEVQHPQGRGWDNAGSQNRGAENVVVGRPQEGKERCRAPLARPLGGASTGPSRTGPGREPEAPSPGVEPQSHPAIPSDPARQTAKGRGGGPTPEVREVKPQPPAPDKTEHGICYAAGQALELLNRG